MRKFRKGSWHDKGLAHDRGPITYGLARCLFPGEIETNNRLCEALRCSPCLWTSRNRSPCFCSSIQHPFSPLNNRIWTPHSHKPHSQYTTHSPPNTASPPPPQSHNHTPISPHTSPHTSPRSPYPPLPSPPAAAYSGSTASAASGSPRSCRHTFPSPRGPGSTHWP